MYGEFFGLSKKPFNMTPDPGFLFLTNRHREALVGLTYAILDRKGFIVLTGDAGTGKTTLLARVLQNLPRAQVQSSVILNPMLTPAEFLELALLDFGLSDVPASKARRLTLLQKLLVDGHREGKISTLVIDEAHKLSIELLEEIRLLGNFEYGDQKLLQIVLLGQLELNDLLERGELRQFKQRVALRFAIEPLSPEEVGQYIRYRWAAAGGAADGPFTSPAVTEVACCSQGVPRVINALCDNAMLLAFSEGTSTVTEKHVREAAVDLKVASVAAAPAIETPAQPVAPQRPLTLHSLERYGNRNGAARSFFGRWAVRLGMAD